MKILEKVKEIASKQKLTSYLKDCKQKYLTYLILLTFLILFNIDINHIVAFFKGVNFEISKHSGNILAPFFAGLCLLLVLGSFLNEKPFKVLLIILTLPLTILNIISTWYIIYYGCFADNIAIDILLSTNIAETKEFIEQVFSYHILIPLILAPIPYIIIYYMKPIKIDSKIMKSILSITFIIITLLTYNQRLVYRNMAVANSIKIYIDTAKARNIFKDLLQNTSLPILDNVTNLIEDDRKQTHILILSESQNKYHFSLYGYNEKTTPFLDSIKDNLYIFNDVKSVSTNTNLCLEKMLTFSDNINNLKGYEAGDIITLFKQAGFKTYWLSNQYYVGEYDNMYSVIAYHSDYKFYTNHSNMGSNTIPSDIALMSSIKMALNEDENKKFIVIHLFGSHSVFQRRYPKGFGKPTSNLNDKDKYITDYNNSIRYTDYFLNEVFKLVEKIDGEGYLLFTPDHGEDVYDTFEDKYMPRSLTNIYRGLVDVPFFIYLNEPYKKAHPEIVKNIESSLNRKYQLDRLPHTLLDLSFIRCEKYNSEDSLVSPDFKEKRRHIDDIDLENIK